MILGCPQDARGIAPVGCGLKRVRARQALMETSDKPGEIDVVFFTSSHCAPCTMLKRKLDALNDEMPDRIRIKTVNVETNDDASKQGIRMVPVLKIVRNNELLVGDMEMDDLRNVLIRSLYFST
jgi:thiol-disulfide isomerase/thioredoxin